MGTFFEEFGDDALVWTPLPLSRSERMLETGVKDLGAPPTSDKELALYDRRGAAKRAARRAGIDGVARLQLPKAFFARADVREEGAGIERRWRTDASLWLALREPLLRFLWLDAVEPESALDGTSACAKCATPEHIRRARGLDDPGVLRSAMLVDARRDTCLGPLFLTDEIPFDDRDFGELLPFSPATDVVRRAAADRRRRTAAHSRHLTSPRHRPTIDRTCKEVLRWRPPSLVCSPIRRRRSTRVANS